jgi:3-phenylpropionate/cinnamic acid dioxygenase small subunit
MVNIEDRETIHDLNARFCHSLDQARFEQWARCFTPDGVFASALGSFQGRQALIDFAKGYHETLGGAQQRHIVSNISVNLEGARGTAVSTLTLYVTREGATQFLGVGIYEDELVKIDGEWLLAKRQVSLDTQPAGNVVLSR